MNQEVKQKWVEILRSGKYQQGKYRLRNDIDEFCCLGVLCDMYHKETGVGEWIFNSERHAYSFFDMMGALPSQVLEWSGITKGNSEHSEYTLVKANDGGSTFLEIANLIENKF